MHTHVVLKLYRYPPRMPGLARIVQGAGAALVVAGVSTAAGTLFLWHTHSCSCLNPEWRRRFFYGYRPAVPVV